MRAEIVDDFDHPNPATHAEFSYGGEGIGWLALVLDEHGKHGTARNRVGFGFRLAWFQPDPPKPPSRDRLQ